MRNQDQLGTLEKQNEEKTYAQFFGHAAARFLYHQKPMAILNQVIEVGPDFAVCNCVVNEENPFYSSRSGVPSWVGIEFMAQCIAVSAGARALLAGKPLPVGLLLGTMSYKSDIDRFQPTETYRTGCKKLVGDEQGLGSFACWISVAKRTIVQARLTVKELEAEN